MNTKKHALHRIAPFVRWCGELQFQPNYCRAPHHIFEHLFVYVLGGHADYSVGGHMWRLGKGDLLLVPPRVPTSIRTGAKDPLWYRFIRFDLAFYDDYERRPMNSREPGARRVRRRTAALPPGMRLLRRVNVSDDSRVPLLFDRVIHEAERKSPGYELMVRACLMELLGLLHRRHSRPKPGGPSEPDCPTPVRLATAFIETHLREKLSLAEIARAVHLSPQHFGRLFRAATGMSPHRYLTCARLKLSKAMLQRPDASVKEAAFSAGFDDQLYFSRVFHRFEGLTPSAYRQAVLSMDGALPLQAPLSQADFALNPLPFSRPGAEIYRIRGPFFTISPRCDSHA